MAVPEALNRTLDGLFSSISCTVLSACQEHLPPHGRLARGAADHYRLYVGLSGTAAFAVDQQTHRLAPGGVILIPPGAAHEASPDSPALLAVIVIDFVARLHGIIDVPAFCGLPVSLMPSTIRRPKIVSSARTIVNHLTNHIPGYQLAVHTHCVRVLDLLWKETLAARAATAASVGTSRPPSSGARPGGAGSTDSTGSGGGVRAPELLRLGAAFRLVEERYARRLTLAELAGTAHLHPVYFSTLFKRVTGLPPLHYLARYRLERARDLLLATDRSLEEIAHLTGFCDAAHLIRVFRRHEGVSPGRYRRALAA